jgi:acyl-CoA synthetase (AMP-forming)/AMP-acid ligase II
MSRYQILRRAAQCWPNETFTFIRDVPLSYADALPMAQRLGSALSELVPKPTVAVLMGNDALVMLTSYGVNAIGGITVSLGAAAKPEANRGIAEKAQPSIMLVDRAHEEDGRAIAAGVPSIKHIVIADSRGAELSELEKMMDNAPLLGDVVPEPAETIVGFGATGGTTGSSKLAPANAWALDTMVANAWSALDLGTYHPIHLVVAPMSHAAGTMATILTPAGATHIIQEKFDAGAVLQAIRTQAITDLYLPPTAIYGLLAHPSAREGGFESLRHIFYAGAPMSAEKLREGLEIFGVVFTQFYGQTEAPLTATCLTPAEHADALVNAPHRLLSCGRPTLFTEIGILNDDGTLAATGENGEVGIRGPLAMMGYVGDRRRTLDEWHRTGDVGHFDSDGYLFLVDRKRDVIVSGGFNVYPIEVEQVLWAHEAVEDCAVIGIPDEKWGESVTAVVQLKPGSSVTADELIALCRDALGPIKSPKRVDFMDKLPKSPVGKVLKRDLRDTYWVGQERRI